MRIAFLVALPAVLLACGCIVISKHEAAARELKQQQSVQEVSRMADSTQRVQEATIRTNESRPDKAGAGLPSGRLGVD